MVQLPVSLILPDAEATLALGRAFGQSLTAGSVLLLEGDLGSGKTTFVQGIGTGLGIIEPIVSPTFVLIQEYFGGRLPLYHLDLYRLEPQEVEFLYPETYWEGQENSPGVVAIEWPDRLIYRPLTYLSICLTIQFDRQTRDSRCVELMPQGGFDLTQLDFSAYPVTPP